MRLFWKGFAVTLGVLTAMTVPPVLYVVAAVVDERLTRDQREADRLAHQKRMSEIV